MAQELKVYNVICTNDISEDYEIDALGAVDFEAYEREDVDEHICKLEAEKDTEIRRLKRALYLARAWYCGRSSEYFSGMASRCKIGQEDFYREVSERARRYMKSSYKCRAKAEEYR